SVSRRIHARWSNCEVKSLRRESVWGAVELARESADHGTLNKEHRSKMLKRSKFAVGSSVISVHGSPVPMDSVAHAPTEQRNPKSAKLDTMPLGAAVELMLHEEALVPRAILREKKALLWLLQKVINAFRNGGRLFYAGAGTSGRLGVLDASECPPTFRAPPEQVQGIIAGGRRAIWSAVEGAEDDYHGGAMAVRHRAVGKGDVLLGIAASGRTPFVWGALHEAKESGACTALLSFNPGLKVKSSHQPDRMILINTGPEVLTGSTRLKAGTATKLVLNILTTLGMVHSGRVISNLMVEMHPTNAKLRDRAVRLLVELTGCDHEAARRALETAGWVVQKAHARLIPARNLPQNHLPMR
ncbi:MAG: N-acetylmuramic acid 6-phosphate etherase, partial [Verrucomicrobiaceae bacterium]